MAKGLESFLKRIRQDPTNETYVRRFLNLLEEEKPADRLKFYQKLFDFLINFKPREALKICYLELKISRMLEDLQLEVEALARVERCFVALERTGKAEVVRNEMEKLREQAASGDRGLGAFPAQSRPKTKTGRHQGRSSLEQSSIGEDALSERTGFLNQESSPEWDPENWSKTEPLKAAAQQPPLNFDNRSKPVKSESPPAEALDRSRRQVKPAAEPARQGRSSGDKSARRRVPPPPPAQSNSETPSNPPPAPERSAREWSLKELFGQLVETLAGMPGAWPERLERWNRELALNWSEGQRQRFAALVSTIAEGGGRHVLYLQGMAFLFLNSERSALEKVFVKQLNRPPATLGRLWHQLIRAHLEQGEYRRAYRLIQGFSEWPESRGDDRHLAEWAQTARLAQGWQRLPWEPHQGTAELRRLLRQRPLPALQGLWVGTASPVSEPTQRGNLGSV